MTPPAATTDFDRSGGDVHRGRAVAIAARPYPDFGRVTEEERDATTAPSPSAN